MKTSNLCFPTESCAAFRQTFQNQINKHSLPLTATFRTRKNISTSVINGDFIAAVFANPLNHWEFSVLFYLLWNVLHFSYTHVVVVVLVSPEKVLWRAMLLNSMKLLTINHSLGNKVIMLETSRTDEMRLLAALGQSPGSLLCNKLPLLAWNYCKISLLCDKSQDASPFGSWLEAFCGCISIELSNVWHRKKLIAKLLIFPRN